APEPIADNIVFTEDVVDGLACAVEETFPRRGDIGLLGGESLTWRWGEALLSRLAAHRIIEADDIGASLRSIKTESEIRLIREAGALGAAAVDAAMAAAVPGTLEAEVAAAAVRLVVASGGAFYGMGLSSGPWAHTFSPSQPAAYSRRKIEAGDMGPFRHLWVGLRLSVRLRSVSRSWHKANSGTATVTGSGTRQRECRN